MSEFIGYDYECAEKTAAVNECVTRAYRGERMTLQDWMRVKTFLLSLMDPDLHAYRVPDEIRRRAMELLELF